MADEDVAPSRAEIESWLWSYNKYRADDAYIENDIREYLNGRGVSEVGIGKILADIRTYSNYPVEEDSAES